jgi:hypothetical protein
MRKSANIRRTLDRLEQRTVRAECPRCNNHGGRRILMHWPGEPLDLEAETACRTCGRTPDGPVKVIDVSDILTFGLNPYELAVAKCRVTGKLTDEERQRIFALRAVYGAVSNFGKDRP